MLWRWCRRRHRQKAAKWIKEKYFKRFGSRDWVFTGAIKDGQGKTRAICLLEAGRVSIRSVEGARRTLWRLRATLAGGRRVADPPPGQARRRRRGRAGQPGVAPRQLPPADPQPRVWHGIRPRLARGVREGLSCVRRKTHVQFLGEGALATAPPYPTGGGRTDGHEHLHLLPIRRGWGHPRRPGDRCRGTFFEVFPVGWKPGQPWRQADLRGGDRWLTEREPR
jgi:hypothetical protein